MQLWVSRSAISSPSEVCGEAPADKRFGAYWSQKVHCAALVTEVFVDFPKNECKFLHKNKLDTVVHSLQTANRDISDIYK